VVEVLVHLPLLELLAVQIRVVAAVQVLALQVAQAVAVS
jgi:hypothetical protein